MAEKKEPRDITDVVKETNGLFKENYLAGLELTTSLWEENLKVLSSQLDRWFALQRDYTNLVRDLSEKPPTEVTKVWGVGLKPLASQVEWFISLQKNYLASVKDISDKFTKDVISLNQKNMERVFSAFSDYLGLLGK
jgi:hypothetical protein